MLGENNINEHLIISSNSTKKVLEILSNEKENLNDTLMLAYYEDMDARLSHMIIDNPDNKLLKNARGQIKASKTLFRKYLIHNIKEND